MGHRGRPHSTASASPSPEGSRVLGCSRWLCQRWVFRAAFPCAPRIGCGGSDLWLRRIFGVQPPRAVLAGGPEQLCVPCKEKAAGQSPACPHHTAEPRAGARHQAWVSLPSSCLLQDQILQELMTQSLPKLHCKHFL